MRSVLPVALVLSSLLSITLFVFLQIDPIGVADVIAAFSHVNCDNTIIETFPPCPNPGTNYIGFTAHDVKANAEEVRHIFTVCFLLACDIYSIIGYFSALF